MALANAEVGARSRYGGREDRGAAWWLPVATAVALGAAVAVVAALVWGIRNSEPGDGSVEAGFARDMSFHHAQAVEMAMLILDRTDDTGIEGLAEDILLTQQNQIGQMRGWLDLWDLPTIGEEPRMAWMGHAMGGPMPGIATREELNHLGELTGVEADREFLRLMIRHHEGGVPMAQAALERSDEEVVRRLARAIIESQTGEVRTMEAMLAERGGAAAS